MCLMMTWTHPDMTLCRHQIPLPVVHTLLDSELGEGKENSAPQFLWCRCFGTRVKGNSVRQTHPVYASSLQSLNNRMPVYETYKLKLTSWMDGFQNFHNQPSSSRIFIVCVRFKDGILVPKMCWSWGYQPTGTYCSLTVVRQHKQCPLGWTRKK